MTFLRAIEVGLLVHGIGDLLLQIGIITVFVKKVVRSTLQKW